MKGEPDPEKELYPLILSAYRHLRDYEGEIPGATAVNCGNYRLHDLEIAKYEAAQFVERLEKVPNFEYPAKERLTTENGETFFDS